MKKKKIVFIESYATVLLYKAAKEFKSKGYETILIRILKPDPKEGAFYDSAYDKIIDINLDFVKLSKKNLLKLSFNLLKNLKNFVNAFTKIFFLKPYIIFGRSNPNSPISFFRMLFKKYPFVYFPYDIRVQLVPTLELAKTKMGLTTIEIKSERFNFEHADGIIHKGAPEELDHLEGRYLGNNIKIPKDNLSFPAYCSDEFIVPINKDKLSKKDGQIHVVCLGSGGKRTKEMYEIYFEAAKPLIKQKIHFHTYVCSNTFSQGDEIDLFTKANKDTTNFDYFHIHESLDPKGIVKEISKYDFAVSLPYYINHPKYDIDPIFTMGNKISTYLEAGLPHFYAHNQKFIETSMKPYDLNLFWSFDGPHPAKDFKKMIKELNIKELEKRIEKARKDFNVKKQFYKLEKFIEKVIKNKKESKKPWRK